MEDLAKIKQEPGQVALTLCSFEKAIVLLKRKEKYNMTHRNKKR